MDKFFFSVLSILLLAVKIQASAQSFENILYVGDSHSFGEFGRVVDQYLRSVSQRVTSTASCGSSPSTWMHDDGKYKTTNCGYWRKNAEEKEIRINQHEISLFQQELEKIKPDLTVIALGTNILSSKGTIARELKFVDKMLTASTQANSKCIWIGPPDLRKNPFKANLEFGVQQLRIIAEKHKCIYIDSTQYTKYPSKLSDGIHYGTQDSKEWGKKVTAEIANSIDTIRTNHRSSNPSEKIQKKSGVR